jgi:hypothetical protein
MNSTLNTREKTVYLIVDGMTETAQENSTLSLARTPVIDGLINGQSRIGFYQPVISPWDSEPKTDIVIPHFFGLPAPHSPGRTVLELLDNGVVIKTSLHCLELKIRFLSQINEENWVNLKQVPDSLMSIIGSELKKVLRGDHFVISGATESGARILLYHEDENWLGGAKSIISTTCNVHGLVVVDGLKNYASKEFLIFQYNQKHVLFSGWAKGSLRGALRFCGLEINDYARKRGDFYDWNQYYRNFDEWIVPRLLNGPYFQRCVFYTKETSFAARRGDKKNKREAIEFMDIILGRFLSVFPDQMFNIVVCNDHAADINGLINPSENTCYALLRGSFNTINTAPSVKFSEAYIASLGTPVISQDELMTHIG